MAELRCAVAVLPAEGGDPARLLRSLDEATRFGMGDFAEIVPLAAPSHLPPSQAEALGILAAAAETAKQQGYDWLLAVTAAETLGADVFAKTAPALRVHDAVWGAAGVVAGGVVTPLERVTRLAAQDLPTLFHAALRWWIGPTHFVRPAAALRALATGGSPTRRADYLAALWRQARSYKTAQALTFFHGGLPPVAQADRQRLVEILEREPVFMPVRYGGAVLHLPYTGLNPVIEREQARGLFFEQEELSFLAERLARGLRIVDAGANCGNHTLFFAAPMQASAVIPIEPAARAVSAIRSLVAENRLGNVDLSFLGCAVGARSGRLKPLLSEAGGLGATRLVEDPAGTVPLAKLDDLVFGPVDLLKIDVEGMEMEVLAGAAGLIARHRPAILVEVLDATIPVFLAWVDANCYRIERLFPDKSHCNYFLVAADKSEGSSDAPASRMD